MDNGNNAANIATMMCEATRKDHDIASNSWIDNEKQAAPDQDATPPRHIRLAHQVSGWIPAMIFFAVFTLVLLLIGVDPTIAPPAG